jgi:hypothetical protein
MGATPRCKIIVQELYYRQKIIKKGPFWGPPFGCLKPNYQNEPEDPNIPNGSDQPNE